MQRNLNFGLNRSRCISRFNKLRRMMQRSNYHPFGWVESLSFGGRESRQKVKKLGKYPFFLVEFCFCIKISVLSLGYQQKELMEWKYLRKGKGQNTQIFIEVFRKQSLNLEIPLDSPETITYYIGSLHSYIRHYFLLFEYTTIDAASVKAIHLESSGKNEK